MSYVENFMLGLAFKRIAARKKLEKDFIAGKIDKAQHRKGMDKLVKERVKMMSNITMNPKMIQEVKRRVKSMKQTTVQKSKSKSKSKSR